MRIRSFKKHTLLLIIVILLGALLRFYKLDWGQGLFTHPDEYHIVGSVLQLSFPSQMHPHFFSYGTVTIYLIYFTKELLSIFPYSPNLPHFPNPFLIGRFYSALFSTLTIIFVYKITALILEKKWALLAAFLAALTPGLIQQAHFATPESNLTFFLFGSLFFILKFQTSKKISSLILASIFLGLSLGVKASSLVFAPTIFLGIIFTYWPKLTKIISLSLLSPFITLITLFIVAPFIFLDFPAFKSNLTYEGGLAAGEFPVFYTRQFIDTLPVLFQFQKILPYTLGQPVMIAGSLGFLLLIFSILKDKKQRSLYLLIITSFLLLFFFNSFLFAKWTRFLAPTFPFFAIFAAYLFSKLQLQVTIKKLYVTLFLVFLLLHSLWSLSFYSIYLRPDIRVTSSLWLESNIPPQTTILVEGGNMVDLPLQGPYRKVSLDFYALEDNFLARRQIALALAQSDYFLVQSRRVFLNHQRLPQLFPKTASFYNALFSGQTGFKEIKEFHSFPTLPLVGFQLEFPDEQAEETWSVFDHPVIRIFQKTKQLSTEEYMKLLGGA